MRKGHRDRDTARGDRRRGKGTLPRWGMRQEKPMQGAPIGNFRTAKPLVKCRRDRETLVYVASH